MDSLANSWGSFSPQSAFEYLRTSGYPSLTSRKILTDILKKYSRFRRLSLIDLGCGNAQLYDHLKEQEVACTYTGVDFSDPLLEAAATLHRGDLHARFIKDDVNDLGNVDGEYDIALYSHVVETLSSPERSLLKARTLAKRIIIRFFEPPDFETDAVELKEMDVGDGRKVPYIRRKMSRDYYRLILTKMRCRRVDRYRDDSSKDQVHVLHY
jgi:SAM-dependent methyltransferase